MFQSECNSCIQDYYTLLENYFVQKYLNEIKQVFSEKELRIFYEKEEKIIKRQFSKTGIIKKESSTMKKRKIIKLSKQKKAMRLPTFPLDQQYHWHERA